MIFGKRIGQQARPLNYLADGSPFGSVQFNGNLAWMHDGTLTGASNDGAHTCGFNPYGAGAYYGLAFGYDWGLGRGAVLASAIAHGTSNVGFCGFQGDVSGLYLTLYGSNINPATAGWTAGQVLGVSSQWSENWTRDPGPQTVSANVFAPFRYTWFLSLIHI